MAYQQDSFLHSAIWASFRPLAGPNGIPGTRAARTNFRDDIWLGGADNQQWSHPAIIVTLLPSLSNPLSFSGPRRLWIGTGPIGQDLRHASVGYTPTVVTRIYLRHRLSTVGVGFLLQSLLQ